MRAARPAGRSAAPRRAAARLDAAAAGSAGRAVLEEGRTAARAPWRAASAAGRAAHGIVAQLCMAGTQRAGTGRVRGGGVVARAPFPVSSAAEVLIGTKSRTFRRCAAAAQPHAAMVSQLLLRDLDGRTRVLRFQGNGASGSVACEEVLRVAGAACALPRGAFRLVTGTREVAGEGALTCDAHGLLPSCTVLLRLLGGKVRFAAAPERALRLALRQSTPVRARPS
jgi:hypothetical protein